MSRVLFLVADLHYSSRTTQILSLLQGLKPLGWEWQVAALRPQGPAAAALAEAGATVQVLMRQSFWDVRAFSRLRQLLREWQPDLLHVCGPAMLAFLHVAVGRPHIPLLVSQPLPRQQRGLRPPWWALRLLRQADYLLLSSEAQRHRCQQAHLPPEKLVLLRPAAAHAEPATDFAQTGGPYTITCVGPLEPAKGLYDAIWTYDMVRRLYPDAAMRIVGEGSEGPRLRTFVRNLELQDGVHFTGLVPDLNSELERASVVWIPSRTDCGQYVLAEALAAGRPVIAAKTPSLAELIVDGESGFLVAPRDRVALARRTCRLFENADLQTHIAQAARQQAQKFLALPHLSESYIDVCRRAAA